MLPHRWKVERTLGWLNRSRRLSKDYEHDTGSSEAMVHLAMYYPFDVETSLSNLIVTFHTGS